MIQAHAHLGYAPRGVGLLYAVTWFEHRTDVFGWMIGAKNGGHLAAYFAMQDYFTAGATRFLRSAQDDVYGPWLQHGRDGDFEVPHPPPIEEALCHELMRLQDQFIRHWLFFADDADAHAEAEALGARELAVRGVNVRAERLGKFHLGAAVWHYDAPGADRRVLAELSKHWQLDYRVEP